MHKLPETGFFRLRQILGDRRASPKVEPLIPVCKSSWWAGVRSGRYPAPVKLGPRTTAWRVEDIRALIASLAEAAGCAPTKTGDQPTPATSHKNDNAALD
ncbi:MAG TPA: AlpA family phage regulatory protein [Candidatus Binatia bacterium]|jgi:predicted DNA-binding transcriptional regulator AlpA